MAFQADTNQIVARANSWGSTEPFPARPASWQLQILRSREYNSPNQHNDLLTQGNTSVLGFSSDRQLNLNLGRLDTRSGLAQAETHLLSVPRVSAGRNGCLRARGSGWR